MLGQSVLCCRNGTCIIPFSKLGTCARALSMHISLLRESRDLVLREKLNYQTEVLKGAGVKQQQKPEKTPKSGH